MTAMTDPTDPTAQPQPIEEILAFWFGELDEHGLIDADTMTRWWKRDPAFDATIRARFGTRVEQAVAGELDDWAQTARGSVALVVLLDQFTRNIYRDTPQAFAADAQALAIARQAHARGQHHALDVAHRYILLMPFMHAESREVQRESLERWRQAVEEASSEPARRLFASGLDYAERHAVIVERFGRYPHRNAILGRDTTPEEAEFLTRPGSSF